MKNETVLRLADIENIIGIKDATGEVARGVELIAALGDRMAVYSGDDGTAMELMLAGAKGDISVTANIAPQQMAKMCQAAIAGNQAEEEALNEPLLHLHDRLFIEANPIPVKWALAEMGRMDGGIRLPLTQLASEFHGPLREAMLHAGLLNR